MKNLKGEKKIQFYPSKSKNESKQETLAKYLRLNFIKVKESDHFRDEWFEWTAKA